MRLGDIVTWRSQSGGNWTKKVGEIVQVVPKGERPDRDRFEKLYRGNGCGFGRKEESYVVAVGNKVYWPVAGKLNLARERDWPKRKEVNGQKNE